MIQKIHFDRMCVVDPKYTEMGIEKVSELIDEGKDLVKKHGAENLNNVLTTEEEFLSVGTLFDFHIASDEALYESE